MAQIIGLVGEKGGGKGTFMKTLQKLAPDKTITTVKFSDTLNEGLDIFALPRTRKNQQDLAVALIQFFGEGTLTQAVKKKVLSQEADIVVVDGIRWMSDYEMVNSIEGNLLVYITADVDTRYERMKERKEKEGEADMSYEQFMSEEKAENEIYIPEIGKHAHFTIENNDGLDEFEKKVKEFFVEYIQ